LSNFYPKLEYRLNHYLQQSTSAVCNIGTKNCNTEARDVFDIHLVCLVLQQLFLSLCLLKLVLKFLDLFLGLLQLVLETVLILSLGELKII